MSPQTQTGTIVDVGCNPPVLTEGALSCTVTSTDLTVSGGTAPYSWATTGGVLSSTSGSTVTLKIGASTAQNHLDCVEFAYEYGAHIDFLGVNEPGPNCPDFVRFMCLWLVFNCYDQWIGWVKDGALPFGFCNSGREPQTTQTATLLGRLACPTCAETTPPCFVDVQSPSGLPPGIVCPERRVYGSSMLFSHTEICNGETALDYEIPGLDPNPSDSTPDCVSPSVNGLAYTNLFVPANFTYGGTEIDATYGAADMWNNGVPKGTLIPIATPGGNCWPCVLLQGSDIVVTVTDALGLQATTVVHVS